MDLNPCKTCRFYVPKQGETGECRYNPPVIQLHRSPYSPVHETDDGCGQWKARTVQKPKRSGR